MIFRTVGQVNGESKLRWVEITMSHQVFCVKSDCGKPSGILQKAFKALADSDLAPEWIEAAECLKLTEKRSQVAFIADPFEGAAFDHLSDLHNRIYGPPCILECLQKAEALPKASHPIYSVTMKGLRICCTGVDTPRKNNIEKCVKYMAGQFDSVFTEAVSHLVAGKIGSKKYLVAGNLQVKIMAPEWVDAVWEACSKRSISIDDDEFTRLRCPIFKNVVLTVSGLDAHERQEVKIAVQREGGCYTGEMKVNDCTHLLIKEPKGQKYEFARKWKIQIVDPKWLRDSIERGYCLDEALYPVKLGKKTSTPSKDKKTSLACFDTTSNLSSIHNFSSMSSITTLDETAQAKIPSGPFDSLETSVFKGDMFLDGCKIFLSGFNSVELEKLRKVINLGGGTRFSQINESVSHVVIGERDKEHIQQLKAAPFRPHVVKAAWLIESFQKGELLPETNYLCLDLPPVINPLSPPPKSRKGSFVKPAQVRTEKPAAISKPPPASEMGLEDDMQQLLVQYMPKGDATHDGDVTQDPDVTCEPQAEEEESLIFKGLLFTILGFASEQENELVEYVHEGGGSVGLPRSRAVPDYGIVPVFGCPVNITVKEVVTNIWLQMCIEEDTLVPVSGEVLFQPVPRAPDATPLMGCVMSISSFSGVLRDCLLHIAEELGACVREYFNKKSVKGKKGSTHLLIGVPEGLEGQKYQAAIKWGVPVVTKEWLLECCRTGKKVPEEQFSPAAVMAIKEEARSRSEHSEERRLSEVTRTVTNKKEEQNQSRNKSVINAGSSSPATTPITQVEVKKVEKQPIPSTSGSEVLVTPVRPKRQSLHTGADATLSSPLGHSTPQAGPSKDSPAPTFKTPVGTGRKSIATPKSLANLRVKQLQDESMSDSKITQLSPHSRGIDSPSKFLDPNVAWQPSFDLTDILAGLATPEGQVQRSESESEQKERRNSSMDLDELFSYHLALGVKNMMAQTSFGEGTKDDDGEEEEKKDEKVDHGGGGDSDSKPLSGVVLGVSKKLNARQGELNNLAASLGADYRWCYDQSCTHFIFQGRSNDNSKEYKLAKEQKKYIVSPHWLTMCLEQNARVDESLFPHNYNPNMSLLVVSTKGDTPSKGTRRSTRHTAKPQIPTTATLTPKGASRSKSQSTSDEEDLEDTNVDAHGRRQSDEERRVPDPEKGDEDENMSNSDNQKKSDGTGSLEMQEAVSKQLEDFMAENKGQRPGRRMSKRFNSNGSEESVGSFDSIDKSRPPSRPRSKLAIQSDNNSAKTTRGSSGSSKTPEPECSQHVEVTWDDPMGRQEQERLASVLHKPYSPTQESLSPVPPGCGEDHANTSERVDYSSVMTLKNFGPVNSPQPDFKPPPTPEAPPLAFPRPKPPATAAPPEAIIALDDERMKGPPKFLFSGIDPSERTTYGALVEQLGGQVHDGQFFDKSCTHLVAGNCSRNEKYLASVAAGKWILHKSYLEACREAGELVKEDDHEWGSDSTAAMKNLTTQNLNLARAAKRWRVKLQTERAHDPQWVGAFQDWGVILCCGKSREGGFRRLLEAGGAKVLYTRPPFTNLQDAMYAFIDQTKIDYQIDFQRLVQAGVHCVKPDYISSYLQSDPHPRVEDCYLPEVRQYLISSSGSKKRQSSDSGSDVGKRARRE
ncbi:DNA topoisomerase 2-binding protein 1-A-like isoform X2 [Lineus longissimus]|uniref:DNA topoisomerase 2-binding protein 1-A-like isoform X2 n=1 Tax=Lineus longissimus TaxID=88925 RepID=UPI00315C591F